jgi:hypothetical protein
MTRFAVGDVVWVPRAGSTELTRPCRICAGNRRVTLILGSGEHIGLDCEFCGLGFEGPRGIEKYYDYAADAEAFVVSGIEVVHDAEGEHTKYRAGSDSAYYTFESDRCYASRDEAVANAARLLADLMAEQDRQMGQKEKAHKSYAWHAGYHLREAARSRKEAERHERKATLMKERDGGVSR